MTQTHDLTVSDLIAALAALPADQQDYAVWCEGDPSGPISQPEHWYWDHERRTVTL